MPELRVKLIQRIARTATVESFRFSPESRIDFIAGQFLQVIFDPGNKENRDLNKYLSFSCAPGKEYIEVTKRLSESNFSQKLRELKIDDRVLVKAPMGSCVFKDEGKKIAFLIGGIGITPVISIIEYITMNKIKSDVLLLYSNRFEEEIAFKKELDYWQAANPDIKICYLVSDGEPKDKACLHGRIDQGLLKNKASDLAQRTVFIFGPPKMVEAMQGLTQEAGCAKENIRIEKFIGY